MIAVLEVPVRKWHCPNCHLTDETREVRPHVRFHTCAALRGLSAPLVPSGVAAKVERMDRPDYVGAEKVQLDDEGKPAFTIVTTRDDGQDVIVFAPTATNQV